MTAEDLAWLDFYGDQVRHLALDLGLFTTSSAIDDVEIEDGDFEPLRPVPAEQVDGARRRRGALLAAANLVFDRVLYELTGAELAAAGEERFVDEYFPPRYRHLYDAEFHRKLLATVAKVGCDLARPDASRPACTAEELVLYAILQEWQVLLDVCGLGQSWTDLTEYLFDDLDFEKLYAEDMDGIENDPIAHLTTGMVVNAIADWFVPFNDDSVVHPYAVERESDNGKLYDLTRSSSDGEFGLADPKAAVAVDRPVRGLEPVSDLVTMARGDARGRADRTALWVPDETNPHESLAAVAAVSGTSGVLTFQTGPTGEITQTPVLEFSPHPAHPATGQAWAQVFFMSGRIELPLAAVVSFHTDPTVRQRWETIFQPDP